MGGKAMSKTKAKAWRRKSAARAPVAVLVKENAKTIGPRKILLTKLMEQHLWTLEQNGEGERKQHGISFCDILSNLGMNDRNTGWRNAWKLLHGDGLIEALASSDASMFTSPFCVSQEGLDMMATDEYKAFMEQSMKEPIRSQTNQELHDHIKSKLMNDRGIQIFDVLLERGPHTRKELSGRLGISDTGAYFSYALKQLKEMGYVEDWKVSGKARKVRLSTKAFVQDNRQDTGRLQSWEDCW